MCYDRQYSALNRRICWEDHTYLVVMWSSPAIQSAGPLKRRMLQFWEAPQLNTLHRSGLKMPLPQTSSLLTSSSRTVKSKRELALGLMGTEKVSFQVMGLSFSPGMILVLNSEAPPVPLLTFTLTQFYILPTMSQFLLSLAQRMVTSTLDISYQQINVAINFMLLIQISSSLLQLKIKRFGSHVVRLKSDYTKRLSTKSVRSTRKVIIQDGLKPAKSKQAGRVCWQAGLRESGMGKDMQVVQIYRQLVFQNMKKLQNYLMKPEQLRKKLQNPRFRQQFIDWTKNNTSVHRDNSTKHSRSRSPVQNIQRSIQLSSKRNNSNNKENMRPQSCQRQQLNISKQSQRTSMALKMNSLDKMNRSELTAKRNVSNASLNKGTEGKAHGQYLNNKSRYNSCTSIDYQRKERAASQVVAGGEKKLKQRYSYRTKQGVQSTNPNKVNQDSLVIKNNLADKNINLYAVADGHGTNGHLVSQYLVKNVGKCFENQLKNGNLTESIPKVFQKLQKGLTQSQINATCSGSTFVSVFFDSQEIVCANVGDSRAILARQIDRKSWQLIYLSQDHKPCIESQKKRILKNGGRIHAFKDEKGQAIGPLRVWLPNQNLQGLAMSRSFGDNVSKPIGVSCEPQIIRMKIDKRDKFVLVASDGVWEFISNQEVLQLIVPYYKEGKLEQACEALSKLAYERWTCEDNSIVDDITFVLIFLQE